MNHPLLSSIKPYPLIWNLTIQPILGPRPINHPPPPKNIERDIYGYVHRLNIFAKIKTYKQWNQYLSSIKPYPFTQHQTISFYPASNHIFRPSIKSYPSTKHWTICTIASNYPLWPSIKPFPSIWHQSIPFDKASNHPLLPSIKPSVPPKVNARASSPFGGTPRSQDLFNSCLRLSVSPSLFLYVSPSLCLSVCV